MHLRFATWLLISTATFINSAPPPIEYKTKLCKYYIAKTHCAYKDKCKYAHGASELSGPVPGIGSSLRATVEDHKGRITELETDLERAWQHINLLERDLKTHSNQK